MGQKALCASALWVYNPMGTDSRGKIQVRWTGAAGLEITKDQQTVLIDPYHSRLGKREAFFKPLVPRSQAIEEYLGTLPGELSSVIVGHTHFDHALDIPEIAQKFHGPIVGSESLERLMALYGLPGRITIPAGNETINLPGQVTVTMIPSAHGLVAFGRVPYAGDIDPDARLPLKARQYRHGKVYMSKVKIGQMTFVHAGSANFVESELEGHRCDVLFMCVPGWKKVPGYCTRLPEILQPEVIIPFHFDDFSAPMNADMHAPPLPFQDMKGFLGRISQAAPQAEIRVPRTFDPMFF